jgi:hypothetical protein
MNVFRRVVKSLKFPNRINNTFHMLQFGSKYPSRGDMPMDGFPRGGYFDPNRKHMSDIFSYIYYHMSLYFKLFTLIKQLFSVDIMSLHP